MLAGLLRNYALLWSDPFRNPRQTRFQRVLRYFAYAVESFYWSKNHGPLDEPIFRINRQHCPYQDDRHNPKQHELFDRSKSIYHMLPSLAVTIR
jgi:hypothetical protein